MWRLGDLMWQGVGRSTSDSSGTQPVVLLFYMCLLTLKYSDSRVRLRESAGSCVNVR